MNENQKKPNEKKDKRFVNPDGKIIKAAAIHYDGNMAAPQVVAKGQGFVAERILQKAGEENIPVVQNPDLAEELTKLDLGEMIPPELYEVVAQVLVFISDLDRLAAMTRNE